MKSYILLLSIALMAFLVNSCYYDEPPKAGLINPENVSFSTHVLPIMASCNYSGCHNQGGTPPDLSAENAYRNLVSGYVNTTIPKNSILYTRMVGTSGQIMPPQGRMSTRNIEIILGWIEKGALND
jgi:hypothetical protein